MHWLHWVFFALIAVVGLACFVVLTKAKTRRRWIWALVTLVGVAGLVALATGNYRPGMRGVAMGVAFDLFAADHFAQYVQTRRAGAPKNVQLVLAAWWLLFGTFQAFWATGSANS
jgi:hypothetical protein